MSKGNSAKRDPIRILLQTTIPTTEDDWSIVRFSLLMEHLTSLKDQAGHPICEVVARNRQGDMNGNDPLLSTLDTSDFDRVVAFCHGYR